MNASIHQTVYIPIKQKDKINSDYCESKIFYIYNFKSSNFERYFWPLKMLSIYRILIKSKNDKNTITHTHSLISNGIISFYYLKKLFQMFIYSLEIQI